MGGVASLGMYDMPSLRQANDTLWDMIAKRLIDRGVADVPIRLDRERSLEAIWSDPNLLLAQCCGYPYATRYRGRLRYLSTPRYAAPGCLNARYRSRLIVRSHDPTQTVEALRGRRAAINQWHSNSGMNMLRAAIAPLAGGAPFFGAVLETGSHAASVHAVGDGDADVAAIDAVSFAHIARDQPALAARVRTMGWTEASPGLPFVTSIATPKPVARLLRGTLEEVALVAKSQPACEVLLLDGAERLPAAAYDELLRFEQKAARQRYPALA